MSRNLIRFGPEILYWVEPTKHCQHVSCHTSSCDSSFFFVSSCQRTFFCENCPLLLPCLAKYTINSLSLSCLICNNISTVYKLSQPCKHLSRILTVSAAHHVSLLYFYCLGCGTCTSPDSPRLCVYIYIVVWEARYFIV